MTMWAWCARQMNRLHSPAPLLPSVPVVCVGEEVHGVVHVQPVFDVVTGAVVDSEIGLVGGSAVLGFPTNVAYAEWLVAISSCETGAKCSPSVFLPITTLSVCCALIPSKAPTSLVGFF